MPGKMGDALYALPSIRELCRAHDCHADFYTSEYCRPLTVFMSAQPCIDDVIIPPDYKIENDGCGVQPWTIPVDESKYVAVYQMGFRSFPDKELPAWIAESVGLKWDGSIQYNVPSQIPAGMMGIGKYYAMAPGRNPLPVMREFIDISPIPIVVIGAEGEYIGKGVDMTGLDMLKMAKIIQCSRGFIGTASSPLVIANGFDIPKAIVGNHGPLEHLIKTGMHHYMSTNKPGDIAECLKTYL